VENILGRAKRLGIKFEEEMEEDLDRLSELQLLLQDAERERVYLDSDGIDTTLQDKVIVKLEEEIHDLSEKIR
jgi:ribosome-interacting GTPase 1